MKVLIINAILYTSETSDISKVSSIKDTMIYDLCLGFKNIGHEVELLCAENYKPVVDEKYDFRIMFGQTILKNIFLPHRLPFIKGINRVIKEGNYDLIISSEVFSIGSLMASRVAKDRLIIWHELAKHNAMMKKIPSLFWYNFIARFLMRGVTVVGRSEDAKEFISKYCKNTLPTYIDHGVSLDKFKFVSDKKNQFIVCSQLIKRKHIDGIINSFSKYLKKYDSEAKLYIVGSGEEEASLKKLALDNHIEDNVIFTGKLAHQDMIPILAESRALLINTEKDNSMISIVESIAVGTPIVMTSIPLNASYVASEELGIVNDAWNEDDLNKIFVDNQKYVDNCENYREYLSDEYKAKEFVGIMYKE